MEHALPRRTAGTPRTWSLCMTSENHGTVGPAGCKFTHAPEKHERVLVVEVPAAAGAPTDQVNLRLVTSAGGQADVDRALRAAQAWVNEEYMCGRRMGKGEPAMSDRAEAAKSECIAAILAITAPVAAQAGQVAVPEDVARDAARYRWMRSFAYQAFELVFHDDGALKYGKELDEAVDSTFVIAAPSPAKEST